MNIPSNKITISTSRLAKRFGQRAVFSNLDLQIAEGESVAIIGPNGAGKTTLLRCLAGILSPSAGEIQWFGRPAATTPTSRLLVGMVAHEGFLYPHLTARENLLFAARMHGLSNPERQTQALLQTVALERHASCPARKLSRGMRQRLTIARALIHDPPILIMDEPFAALDAEGAKWLTMLMHDLRRRMRTICFTTHDVAVARACADRILMLRSGALREFEDDMETSNLSRSIVKAA